MEPDPSRRRRPSILLMVVGALAGLLVAVIVVLNVHILVGLEEGYASTPAEVAEQSPVLLVVDILLTVGLPVLGAMAALRLLRRRQPPVRS